MADVSLKTRIKQKTDTSANWAKATNFVPLKGEIIVYSDLNRIKIGDGVTKVTALPFLADGDIKGLQDALDKKFDKTGGTITGYTGIKVNTPSDGDFVPLFSVRTLRGGNGFTWYTQNDGESAGQSYIAFEDRYPIYLKMWNNHEDKYQKIYLPSTNGLQDRTFATEDVVEAHYLAKSLTSAKGDMIYASAANTPARLGIGSNGQFLSIANGIPKWVNNPNTDTHYTNYLQIKGNNVEAVKFAQNANKSLNLKPGNNVSISATSGEITISATDTNTWRPIGTGANDAAAGNHTHDGRYLKWGGSAANVDPMGWGTLTVNNGYAILSHASSNDGGDWGMVNKDGKIFMQLDGYYYQNEGQYRVLDTSDSGSFATSNHTHTSINTAFVFNNNDMPEAEGSANLSATTNAHQIYFYRNGLSVPYQMNNANDGGILRCRGDSESNVIFELGTWDDSGAGETIQFNYYPTTSQATPTYSVTVPKKTGTILLTTDSSSAGNAAADKVVVRNAAGSIQTEKLAVSSGTTTKATMQYNSAEGCIEFIFA